MSRKTFMPGVEPVADQPQPTVNLPPEPDEKLAIAEHQLTLVARTACRVDRSRDRLF